VLVYDSTRELLAIEVRERKGEQLRKEGDEEREDGNVDSSGADVSEGKAPPSSDGSMAPASGRNSDDLATSATNSSGQKAAVGTVLYENKRYRPTDGQAIATAIEGDAAAEATSTVASSVYMWQYRWLIRPDEVHGPFDSVTMQGWVNQACFSDERVAEVRQCDDKNVQQEHCWHRWNAVDFELYI